MREGQRHLPHHVCGVASIHACRWDGFNIIMTGIAATVLCGWYLDRYVLAHPIARLMLAAPSSSMLPHSSCTSAVWCPWCVRYRRPMLTWPGAAGAGGVEVPVVRHIRRVGRAWLLHDRPAPTGTCIRSALHCSACDAGRALNLAPSCRTRATRACRRASSTPPRRCRRAGISFNDCVRYSALR